MIELGITGGLGNQMFQYACARALQLELGKEQLIININLYKIDKFGRRFSLNACNIPRNSVRIVNKSAKIWWLLGSLGKPFDVCIYNILKLFGIYIWKNLNYRKLECKGDCVILFGYFQSEKYFKKYANIIRDELKIIGPLSEHNKRLIDKIRNNNSVCIHIRRGDFVKEGLVMCDNQYYRNGIDYIKNNVSDPKFFIFSDDIKWVKENFLDESFEYVDANNNDYDDIRLMYNCKHFIMSNSTFSWWAQYLSDYQDKIVIAPPKWLPNNSVTDIYLDSWTIL